MNTSALGFFRRHISWLHQKLAALTMIDGKKIARDCLAEVHILR